MTVDELFDAWERAWSGRDPAAFAPLCAPSFHYEDPLTSEPLEHPDALASHALRLWHAFPDARVNRTGDRLDNGTYACAPCKVLGTHRGELEGLPASGRFVVVHLVCYLELDARGSRVLRARSFLDAYDAAVQLGVLPARGTLGERALLMLRGFGLRSRS